MSAYPSTLLCQLCEDEVHEGTHECCECKKVMCQERIGLHKRKYLEHIIVSLAFDSEQSLSLSPVQSGKNLKCPSHISDLDWYCVQCEQPICTLCLHSNHKNHSSCKSSVAYEKREKVFPELYRQSELLSQELKQANNDSLQIQNIIQKQREETMMKIKQWYEGIRAVLEKQYQRLMSDLDRLTSSKIQILEQQSQAMTESMKSLTSFTTKLKTVAKAGPAEALLAEYQLRLNLRGISDYHKSTVPQRITHLEFHGENKGIKNALEKELIIETDYSPNHCTAEGDGLMQVFPDQEMKFMITLRDNKNQPYKFRAYEKPVISFERINFDIKSSVNENGNGTIAVSYRLPLNVKDAKELKISVRIRNQPIKGSPFSVKIVGADWFDVQYVPYPELKSQNSLEEALLRIQNHTESYNFELEWIDFKSQLVSYGIIKPKEEIIQPTFITHPWIIRECRTRKILTSFSVEHYRTSVTLTARDFIEALAISNKDGTWSCEKCKISNRYSAKECEACLYRLRNSQPKDPRSRGNPLQQGEYHLAIIAKWLQKLPSSLTLLYKASRDGWNNSIFHSLCDNKGSTITILRNNKGYVFGGYTTVAWDSTRTWKSDEDSFLFSMTDGKGRTPFHCPLFQNKHKAIFCSPGFGPVFGSGNLRICNDLVINLNSPEASRSGLNNSYKAPTGMDPEQCLAGSSTGWSLMEMEVYRV